MWAVSGLSDEITEEAVSAILRGTYTAEGVDRWWDRPRVILGGSSPRQSFAASPDAVMDLAVATLYMTAT